MGVGVDVGVGVVARGQCQDTELSLVKVDTYRLLFNAASTEHPADPGCRYQDSTVHAQCSWSGQAFQRGMPACDATRASMIVTLRAAGEAWSVLQGHRP